ncbi:MAG TPA: DUF2254 domain-containing protein [Acidimicrobiales bacterium]|nr:DUF2254 domain-containing protein [Acidimicrobiales bacterium]
MSDVDEVLARQPARVGKDRRKLPSWRWEELRTTLWVVPSIIVVVSALLFVVTFEIDVSAFHHPDILPTWIRTGGADAERQVLIAIAAAVITVVGVVFSITILALTLASQQFGPRMMRNFVRDIGNQVTLGIFVGTFVYSVLVLGSINSLNPRFVPYLSTSIAEALLLVDLGVLIYFIHHIAKSIQLPEVIASIAADLMSSIDAEFPERVGELPIEPPQQHSGKSVPELLKLIEERGAAVPSQVSGYIQYVGYSQLIAIATRTDSFIRLEHRPGHFLATGRPLAMVWPRSAAPEVALALGKAHVTGPHRTLVQDPVFAIDQLVEIAIRALSSVVNDTFTTLTCIDWLSAGLGRVSGRVLDEGVYRDSAGRVRLIEFDPSYARMVNRAFDKIRQSAGGMPAVLIRLIDSLGSIMLDTTSAEQRTVLRRQADMVLRLAEATVAEENDLEEIRFRYRRIPGEDAFTGKSYTWSQIDRA